MTARHVITGGSGFVGARLAQALRARGEEVVIFDIIPPAGETGRFVQGDIRNMADIYRLALAPGDVVYHLAARQFHGPVPRRDRLAWFEDVNTTGTRHLLEAMARGRADRLIFFSTDMTYGHPERSPVPHDQVQRPIGPYGQSKCAAEKLIFAAMAERPLVATIFRPRLIAGAGRLGILTRLFALIDRGLPVPMIGSGRNRYQMIAVADCVAAALRAVERGMPRGAFNLGSIDPPTVKALLQHLIRQAGSRSLLMATPALLVKSTLAVMDRIGLTLLYPEQFAIADADYVLDTSHTAKALDWVPQHSDGDILFAAYDHYRGVPGPVRRNAQPSDVGGLNRQGSR